MKCHFCQTPVIGLGLGIDFTFAGDNHNHKNHKSDNNKNDNNPHLNFAKGTVLGDKEQGILGKTEVEFDTEDQVLSTFFIRFSTLDQKIKRVSQS